MTRAKMSPHQYTENIYIHKNGRAPRPGWAYRTTLCISEPFKGRSETKRMRERERGRKLILSQPCEQKRIRTQEYPYKYGRVPRPGWAYRPACIGTSRRRRRKKERTKPHVEGIGTDAIQHYPTLTDTNLH